MNFKEAITFCEGRKCTDCPAFHMEDDWSDVEQQWFLCCYHLLDDNILKEIRENFANWKIK